MKHMEAKTDQFVCDICGAEFDSNYALAGHVGGLHVREKVDIEHGTPKGAVMHRRRKVPMTEECGCREAWNEYQIERRKTIGLEEDEEVMQEDDDNGDSAE